MRKLSGLIAACLIMFSCGGSLQEHSSAPEVVTSSVERNGLVFDPFGTEKEAPIGIPFPNDALWKETGGYLYLDTSNVDDVAKKALYEAINRLKIRGFSPNTPLIVPLINEIPVDTSSLKGKYRLIDVTSEEDQTNRLTFKQDGRYLKFYPVKPLEPGHRYALILLKGIKDVNGNDLIPPQAFGGYYLQFKDSLDKAYQIANVSKDNVLEASLFTTADKTLSSGDLGALKAYLLSLQSNPDTPFPEIEGLPYQNIGEDYKNFDQAVDAVLGLIPLSPELRNEISNKNFPAFDITKLKELLEKVTLGETFDIKDYVKFIPVFIGNGENYSGSVYIFQHGLGGYKEQAENLLGDINLPVVAIDLPFHGDYTKLTENSQTECGGGKCFLTSNVTQNRLNIYQAVFNLRLLEKLLRAGLYDIDGDGNPDTPSKVYFLGVSMGAITGSIYANVGSPDKVVLNVGGANLISIVDTAKNETIKALLEATGVKKNTYAYAYLLGIFQLILDSADPIYLAIANSTKTLLQNAYGDTVVPNVSNEALAKRVGFDQYTSVENPDPTNPPSPSPGWYMFGNEDNWVHHGFLLHTEIEKYPEAEGKLDLQFVENAQTAARKQINDFFNQ
ncbi:Ig-like domain-containing protein [Phorcysia thermohydrogeniphila]|uniref:Virulence factor lipase-like protein n=1 Tax=Phorcysia thermohydrogeniphila TaxID=936138 RepID=A0A4R1G9S5_9BACT|nr:Ig-like domain-containing protein [Phorcysia thermohydrogeniphila]TCK03330.1 hypothetical protein CLV27_1401 [Phorcysia thermohydrogeniphila]